MTKITIAHGSEGLFWMRHAGKSNGYKTAQEAWNAAEALKADLGGKATISEIRREWDA